VDPVDEAHPVAPRAHDERVRAGAVGEEADAAQQVSVRDAGRGDDHLARRKIFGPEDALVVEDPGLAQLLPVGRQGLSVERRRRSGSGLLRARRNRAHRDRCVH